MVLDTQASGGVRMEDVVETREEILADVESDPRLSTRKERCAIYRELVEYSRGFGEQDYWKVAGGACAAFPLAEFPWEGS
jgi:hypothetical protein